MRSLQIQIAAELPDDERRAQEALARHFQNEIIHGEITVIINGFKVKKGTKLHVGSK